jgi:hypothetical protein
LLLDNNPISVIVLTLQRKPIFTSWFRSYTNLLLLLFLFLLLLTVTEFSAASAAIHGLRKFAILDLFFTF